jgi:hypothetical protein
MTNKQRVLAAWPEAVCSTAQNYEGTDVYYVTHEGSCITLLHVEEELAWEEAEGLLTRAGIQTVEDKILSIAAYAGHTIVNRPEGFQVHVRWRTGNITPHDPLQLGYHTSIAAIWPVARQVFSELMKAGMPEEAARLHSKAFEPVYDLFKATHASIVALSKAVRVKWGTDMRKGIDECAQTAVVISPDAEVRVADMLREGDEEMRARDRYEAFVNKAKGGDARPSYLLSWGPDGELMCTKLPENNPHLEAEKDMLKGEMSCAKKENEGDYVGWLAGC